MPSVANIIGTDLSRYKLVNKNKFACNRMHVGRDNRIPIAISESETPFMVSPAYDVFKIKDENLLNPHYLMMWFQRKEFDRECTFHTDADVRGGLTWEDFCDMKLPVPPISEQHKIVAEYQTIENKIKVNQQICQKLEATVQAIYKEWFVEFNFPDEEGKPYKDNGGKMSWNEELEKEVPEGWEMKELNEICEIKAGGDKPQQFSEFKTKEFNIPIFSNGIINEGLYGFTNKANFEKGSTTISARGTIGYCVLRNEDFDAIVRLLVLKPKLNNFSIYLWHTLQKIEFADSGSVQKQLTIPQISKVQMLFPKVNIVSKYEYISNKFYKIIEKNNIENQKLTELKSLLLARMVK